MHVAAKRPCARTCGTGLQRRSFLGRASPIPVNSTFKASPAPVGFKQILLTIMDANEYLSDGSKQAVALASSMAFHNSGKVTVLVVDEEGTKAKDTSATSRRLENISWHFKDQGFENYSILEKDIASPASVLIADVADELQADLCLLSSEAVHAKHVDANQLAEFVTCPLLLTP